MNIPAMIRKLRGYGLLFDPGLTSEEVEQAEREYGIVFPPDLRALLETALPRGEKFPNWRDFSERNKRRIREKLDWPLEGLLFDVEYNRYWHTDWGERPSDLNEAKAAASLFYHANIPKLIPIYSHRYLPETPHEAENPVFSVWQADVILYGEDLKQYFEIEFGGRPYTDLRYENVKPIVFWSELSE